MLWKIKHVEHNLSVFGTIEFSMELEYETGNPNDLDSIIQFMGEGNYTVQVKLYNLVDETEKEKLKENYDLVIDHLLRRIEKDGADKSLHQRLKETIKLRLDLEKFD